jgi:hypothetical protein
VSQSHRTSRSLGPLCVLISCLGGCQPLNTGAALGAPYTYDAHGDKSGIAKPELTLDDGTVVDDACEATRIQAYQILDRTCGNCHGGGAPGARQGSPPFDTVLDEERMLSIASITAKDPDTLKPSRFLVAGDPEHSRIYVRVQNVEMPPPDIIGLPPNPRPSASDLSVLHHWIKSCIQTSDSAADGDVPGAEEDPTVTH